MWVAHLLDNLSIIAFSYPFLDNCYGHLGNIYLLTHVVIQWMFFFLSPHQISVPATVESQVNIYFIYYSLLL